MRARVSTSAYHFDFRARCGGTRHLATSNQQPATNNRIVPRLRKRAHAETGRVPDPTIRRGSTSALGLPHEQCASRLLSPRGVDPAVAWYLRRPRPRASRRHARRGAGGERLPPDGARRRVAARPRHVQRPVAADVDDDGVASDRRARPRHSSSRHFPPTSSTTRACEQMGVWRSASLSGERRRPAESLARLRSRWRHPEKCGRRAERRLEYAVVAVGRSIQR